MSVGRWVLLVAVLQIGCAAPPTSDAPSPDRLDDGDPIETGVLTVENRSGQTIFGLQFAQHGDHDWGWDRLGGSDVLKNGKLREWELPAGTYRVRAELADGAVVEAGDGYDVLAGDEVVCVIAPAGAEKVGSLTLINGTGFAIAQVRFSLTSEMGWGEDRLDEGEVLKPGGSRTWQVPAGRYNLRVQFQDETSLEAGDAYEVVAGERAIYRLKN